MSSLEIVESTSQQYMRILKNFITRIESELDKDSADAIFDNIKKFLGDQKVPEKYWKNIKNPQTTLVRELKSLKSEHFVKVCYNDGWGWGCGICVGGEKSKHWEGIELKKWSKFAVGRWKRDFCYKESLMLDLTSKFYGWEGYHEYLHDYDY